MKVPRVTVIGAGLAGSEAAWQLAKAGIEVDLYEMRPTQSTPAHHTPYFAELVCTNSLRSNLLTNAVGLLKEEMRRLDSIIIRIADLTAVPAGGALAVDREQFSADITKTLENHPLIRIYREEVKALPQNQLCIVATGPLTSQAMSEQIARLMGEDYLYFFDAAAPILTRESVNMDKVFAQSRYDKGDADYLNCPFTEQEFDDFYDALVHAETAPLKEFEEEKYFEGCMPIEVMAKRGKQTLLFGSMKPVGLTDPRTGKRPFAVVQLRQDNAAATLLNMVGFQTHLKWGEQTRVFRMIPGLENAEIVRFGVMHRNTYINSPKLLNPTYQAKMNPYLFFAGQMTGVEGYVESAAAGLVAGINAGRLARNLNPLVFPQTTAIGSLAHYITQTDSKYFQPMNATFGLLPPLDEKIVDKKKRAEKLSERALYDLQKFLHGVGHYV
ncbi:methylenetetrahydrofolate--tRNA-(uracil(54)-C(5))-methyltransferase (FADH(2)-oxidizing) TrmFO [Alicyclobacillus tolerans]|uniref:methylenetetrahydrofolate--tRNA-(uracil(54)- C(5))-methyltransferase (FADH(2)-oxidizing) TrmFO n=1 Tax=Alicyclobacillus TaxID=29330 RepID=UPI000932D29F|nr:MULTISPECIES: methylenetetrahydrofolate--tRNA-(uracil(54)-C(5))-methyltransferase (FADH(2)-oxidizing) TrmFO [Alicyclobacillus]